MKVGIVGGGAIGLLFGAYLSECFEVTMYTRTSRQAKALIKKGITVVKNDEIYMKRPVQAVPFKEWNKEEDLTIVTVKQYDLKEVIEEISRHDLSATARLLFTQNGMGHLGQLSALKNENILVGVVEHGALRLNTHTVDHTGEGISKLAIYRGDTVVLQQLISNEIDSFLFKKEKDFQKMLLEKLVVNVMINPLTTVLRVNNGQLVENSYYFDVFVRLFKEVTTVFEIRDSDATFEHVVQICKKTAGNQSSMLKDVLEGRPTEVEAIVGYVVSLAKEKQVEIPLLQMLYEIIKGIELEKGAP